MDSTLQIAPGNARRPLRGRPSLMALQPFPPIIPTTIAPEQRMGASSARKGFIDTVTVRDDHYWRNRVMLHVELPRSDHSYIIGRQGHNHQAIMRETGCHIHFPEEKDKYPSHDKLNKVTIAGFADQVESARQRIRESTPLTIALDVSAVRADVDLHELSSDAALGRTLGFAAEISVVLRCDRSRPTSCQIRAATRHEKALITACEDLRRLWMKPESAVTYGTSLEITSSEQSFVFGRNRANLHYVMRMTGVAIATGSPPHTSTLLISGSSPNSVVLARKYLMGLSPVQYNFNIASTVVPNAMQRDSAQLARELNLEISVKNACHGFPEALICVRGAEFRLSDVYLIRHRLLNLVGRSPVCSEYNFMAEMVAESHCAAVLPAIGESSFFGSPSATTCSSLSGSQVATPTSSSIFHENSTSNFLQDPRHMQQMWEHHAMMNYQDACLQSYQLGVAAAAAVVGYHGVANAGNMQQQTPAGIWGSGENVTGLGHAMAACMGRDEMRLNDSGMSMTPLIGNARVVNPEQCGKLFSRSMTVAISHSDTVVNSSRDNEGGHLGTTDDDSTETRSDRRVRLLLDTVAENSERAEDENEGGTTTAASDTMLGRSCCNGALRPRKGILRRTARPNINFAFSSIDGGAGDSFTNLDWDVEKLKSPQDVLRQLGLMQFETKFVEQGIDMEALLLLNDKDFQELGFDKMGARRKLSNAIKFIRAAKQSAKENAKPQ